MYLFVRRLHTITSLTQTPPTTIKIKVPSRITPRVPPASTPVETVRFVECESYSYIIMIYGTYCGMSLHHLEVKIQSHTHNNKTRLG